MRAGLKGAVAMRTNPLVFQSYEITPVRDASQARTTTAYERRPYFHARSVVPSAWQQMRLDTNLWSNGDHFASSKLVVR